MGVEKESSKIKMPPYTKEELEGDILELLCVKFNRNEAVHAAELCRYFKIGKKTMTAILKPMQEKGYLIFDMSDGSIDLTEYGRSQGKEYKYRHDSISQFLQFIGVSAETADRDACRAEHIFTDETIRTICEFANRGIYHDRKIWNTELSDRYETGRYEFMMQMYSMEQQRPRKFQEEYACYTERIFLEVSPERSWFELERRTKTLPEKQLWYKSSTDTIGGGWTKAECGQMGERLPVNAFEFVLKPNALLMEGHLLIAFTKPDEHPDLWNSCQLEVELW